MKTTIDLPDTLYRRLKIRAAESGVTIRHLVVQGIERELAGDIEKAPDISSAADDQRSHSYVDGRGWPVLKRSPDDHTVVTNEFVNRLREDEGV
ncbi:MAG: antitoxin [Spirochaetaceae bacterium]|nr:MAG: antitoxin [Spirochaetaceae bacterium]